MGAIITAHAPGAEKAALRPAPVSGAAGGMRELDGSIDAGSSPSWFIPEAEQLPVDDGGAGPDSLEASAPDGQTAQGAP